MSFDTLAASLDVLALAYFLLATSLYRIICRQPAPGASQPDRGRADAARELDAQYGPARQPHARRHPARQPGPGQRRAIAVGGLAVTMGSGERLHALLDGLPWVAASTPTVWIVKQLLIMAIFIYAFFKFAWAFRLSHSPRS